MTPAEAISVAQERLSELREGFPGMRRAEVRDALDEVVGLLGALGLVAAHSRLGSVVVDLGDRVAVPVRQAASPSQWVREWREWLVAVKLREDQEWVELADGSMVRGSAIRAVLRIDPGCLP